MFEVFERVAGRKTVIATAETFEAAKAAVEARGVAFMEDDADYPGCADAYLNDGRIVSIQPVGFVLPNDGAWASKQYEAGKAMANDRAAAMASFDAEFGIK